MEWKREMCLYLFFLLFFSFWWWWWSSSSWVTTIGRQRQYRIASYRSKVCTWNSLLIYLSVNFPFPPFSRRRRHFCCYAEVENTKVFVHFLIAMNTHTTYNIFILLILLTPPHHSLFSLYSFYSDVRCGGGYYHGTATAM